MGRQKCQGQGLDFWREQWRKGSWAELRSQEEEWAWGMEAVFKGMPVELWKQCPRPQRESNTKGSHSFCLSRSAETKLSAHTELAGSDEM